MIGYLDLVRKGWKACHPPDREIIDLLGAPRRLPECECVFLHLTDLRRLQLFAGGNPNVLDDVESESPAYLELFEENSLLLWKGLQDYRGRLIVYRGEAWNEYGRRELRQMEKELRGGTLEPALEALDRNARTDQLALWLDRHLRPAPPPGLDAFEAVLRLTLDLELLKLYRAKGLNYVEAQLELPGLSVLKPPPDLAPLWGRLRERSHALAVSARTLKPDLQFIEKFLKDTGAELEIPMEYEEEWIKRLSPTTGKNAERG